MSTKTTTKTSHYWVQKNRRAKYIEEWKKNHRTVIRVGDVKLQETQRGIRQGAYMGEDGDNPTRSMDAWLHEVDTGVVSTIHRHSWDVMVWGIGGEGWIEIDGERIKVAAGDSAHIPAWAWHRSGNDNDNEQTFRYSTFSSEPMLATMGMSVLEDRGNEEVSALPGRPAYTSAEGITGDDVYARRLRRLGKEQDKRRNGRLRTEWDELEMLNTPRGTRTTFLLDRAIGYEASGISMAMFEIGQGRQQSMHRHPGEAWLYVIEGEGHSYLGSEPEGGENHEWTKGDLIIVDHFLWHQHFNDSKENTARVVRIHMFDSLLDTMKALMDPMVLFEEPPMEIRDKQAGNVEEIVWPELTRPTWP